ncbi:MAG TPA: hypothetical protein VMV07_07515 [Streptosporangiaceae bacterium]|nr:hypothetical protein [Streptosporangiaceae bacterium]
MHCAGPPGADGADGGHGEPLRVAAAGRQAFEGSSDAALDPMLRSYLSDLVAPYGLGLREDLLGQGRGQSYGEMAGALLTQTMPPGQPVDLIVLAFAVHDVVPGRSTAAHLSYLCPGAPMAFAVCDQGTAAPFAALRLIREYARGGSCQRALLVVVEQETLHYELAAPGVLPTRGAAVALLCGPAGAGRLAAVRQHAGVSAAQAGDLLASELAALAAGRDDVTLIVGGSLAGLIGAVASPGPRTGRSNGGRSGGQQLLPPGVPAIDQVLVAPAGQPSTGVWWELAGGLPDWTARGRRVLLADYEPELRYLSVSAIDVEAGPVVGARQVR